MFLNVSFLGLSMFTSQDYAQLALSYDLVTLYGPGIFDKIWIRNNISPSDYENIEPNYYNPTWDNNTVLLAEFDNVLSAGNVDLGEVEPTGWILNKRRAGTLNNQRVAKIPYETRFYKDFAVQKGTSYVYQVTPYTDTVVGTPMETSVINSDYYGWFLIDEDTGISIKFDINVSSGNLSTDTSLTEYETFNRFNTVAVGNRNFIRGSISGIVPESWEFENTGIFQQSADFIKVLQDFINNGHKKLLKSRKGDIWRVITNNFSRSQVSDNLQEQVDVVSFDFIEVEEVTHY